LRWHSWCASRAAAVRGGVVAVRCRAARTAFDVDWPVLAAGHCYGAIIVKFWSDNNTQGLTYRSGEQERRSQRRRWRQGMRAPKLWRGIRALDDRVAGRGERYMVIEFSGSRRW
jgi:hypothetical protein